MDTSTTALLWWELSYWWFHDAQHWWRGGWASVGLPLTVLVILALTGRWRWQERSFWLQVSACAALTWASGQWWDGADVVSLHLMPSALVVIAAWLYWRVPITASSAYALTFLSLLAADALSAGIRFGLHTSSWWVGLGGAGLQDGLFFFPLVSALLVHYARWRRCYSPAGA